MAHGDFLCLGVHDHFLDQQSDDLSLFFKIQFSQIRFHPLRKIGELLDKEEQVGFDAGDVSVEERPIVEDFLQHVTAMGMMRKKARLDKYRKLCQVFQTKLDELDARGVWVFGDRSNQMNPGGDARKEGMLVFKRADDPEIICPQLLRQFGKAMCFISVAVAH